MTGKPRHRPVALEYAVFGAAAALAVFLLYVAARRVVKPAAPAPPAAAAALDIAAPAPAPPSSVIMPTRALRGGLAPLGTRDNKRRRPAVVPAPR